MSESPDKWNLTILAAHSQRWSQREAQEFRAEVSSLVARLEGQMRIEHPSLHLQPLYIAAGGRGSSQAELGVSFAFAIIDITDYDTDLAILVGRVQGAQIPYALTHRADTEGVTQRLNVGEASVIPYESTRDLVTPDSPLDREISQAISPSRVLEELVYELWFQRDTTTIWVVCPQIHEPGEFAKRSSPDYTYLDNLGDTDALLEIMVFLSRYYPKASVEKFSCEDLPRDHTKNNLVVIGGPGSHEEISNNVCKEMMISMNSRVSYAEDCERMLVTLEGVEPLELKADLGAKAPDQSQPGRFNMRRDCGYFARFPNPLNEMATVILVNGIHTAGVLGAARAFADRREAFRNYHSVFNSGESPKSFESHFEVEVLNGDVRVPVIAPRNIYALGTMRPASANALLAVEKNKNMADRDLVTVMFIAGDRGGYQRSQIQSPKELDSIREALQGCKHRESFNLAQPILAATREKLVAAYRDQPTILHFAGHGDDRSLSFILDHGQVVSTTPILEEQLATILGSFPSRVSLCVLNTCDSEPIAKHLVDKHVVDAAIGWPARLTDAVAITFSRTLYRCLGDGLVLARSVILAAESCGSDKKPVVYTDAGVDQNVFSFIERKQG
jgi:cellobiose-specific phosphotransferase system component IIA